MNGIRSKLSYLISFFKVELWNIRSKEAPWLKGFGLNALRIGLLTLKGFAVHRGPLRAASLTFYTLLSIVPVVAMAFGIAKGFGFEAVLEKELFKRFAGQEEVLGLIIDFSRSLLQTTKGGVVAGIGIIILFWSVLKVLSHIEDAMNTIWETKPRTLSRKFSDYLSIMLICPILVILSASTTVYIATQVRVMTSKIGLLEVVSPLIFLSLKLLPFGLIWILFTFLYKIMPNKRVHLYSALMAGIIAGTIYQFAQGVYINFQIFMARYNAIYGSFAALPLFLIWVQLSWQIVLLGAEISYSHQNVTSFEFSPHYEYMNPSSQNLLSLQISHFIISKFAKGESAPSAKGIAIALGLPMRPVGKIINILIESKLISAIEDDHHRQPRYQPAQDINKLSIYYILDAVNLRGKESKVFLSTREWNTFSSSLKTFEDLIQNSPENKLLKDI